MATPGSSKQDGRSSLAAIAAVLVVGVALGAMILSMGRSKQSAQDDDTPSPKTVSAQPAKTASDEIVIDDAQAKAAGITIESAAPARITSAPISASNELHSGAGPIPAISITLIPLSGPADGVGLFTC